MLLDFAARNRDAEFQRAQQCMLFVTSAFGRIYDVAGREREGSMARNDEIRGFVINGIAAAARAYKKLHALRLAYIGKGLPDDRDRVTTVVDTQLLGEYIFKEKEDVIAEKVAKANLEVRTTQPIPSYVDGRVL